MTKYNHWQQDLSAATKAIESIQYTEIPKLIAGKIYSVECSDNSLLLMMDRHSGIDYIRKDKKGLQGVASRVQFGSDFRTFTIRASRNSGAKTELEKRREQIAGGYFYPALTLQAYFDNREDLSLKSIAVVKTKSLYDFIESNPDKVYERQSDNLFIYCKWKDMIKAGVDVKTIIP